MPAKDKRPSDWLTVVEAAELVSLHPKTIERACRGGALAAERFARVWMINRRALLEYWMASQAANPALRKQTAKGAKRKNRASIRRAA